MLKEIEKDLSFLGFKLILFISFSNPLLFYFYINFKKVKLINIFFGNLKSSRDYWFKLFGKVVFSNVHIRGKNV